MKKNEPPKNEYEEAARELARNNTAIYEEAIKELEKKDNEGFKNVVPVPKTFLEELIEVQKEIGEIEKDAKNPFFKKESDGAPYATYDTIVKKCKEVCNQHGMFISHIISIVYGPNNESQSMLTTLITHTSGEKISSEMPLLNKVGTDQGMGSSITYAKRYTLQSLLAIGTKDDDDGNSASHGEKPKGINSMTETILTETFGNPAPQQPHLNTCPHDWMKSKYHLNPQGQATKEFCKLCKQLRDIR